MTQKEYMDMLVQLDKSEQNTIHLLSIVKNDEWTASLKNQLDLTRLQRRILLDVKERESHEICNDDCTSAKRCVDRCSFAKRNRVEPGKGFAGSS